MLAWPGGRQELRGYQRQGAGGRLDLKVPEGTTDQRDAGDNEGARNRLDVKGREGASISEGARGSEGSRDQKGARI